MDGSILHKWSGVRIMDLAVTVDGKTLVAVSENKIRLYDLCNLDSVDNMSGGDLGIPQSDKSGVLIENNSITSVYICSDGQHLLVNLSTQVI